MRGRILVALTTLAAIPLTARASERVKLRNGFDLRCDHHAEVDGKVRLYAHAGEDEYIEIPPREIADVENVDDPPVALTATPGGLTLPGEPAKPTAAAPQEANLSDADLREMLAKAGGEHNVDADLLASVVKAESNGNVRAVSRAGARGLMQLMPGTASQMGVADSFRPEENVRGGSAYLDAMLTRYHDNLALALAAYNAGPQSVDKYRGIPPYRETQAYVARVIHEFNRRVLARRAQERKAQDRQAQAGAAAAGTR